MNEFEHALFTLSNEFLLLVEPDSLTVVAANPTAERRLGYAPGALRGLPINALECALSDVFFWEEVVQGQPAEIADADGLYRTAGGQVLPVVKTMRPVMIGESLYIAIAARVVLQEKVQHQVLDKLTALLDATLAATADGVLVTDINGAIVNMNRRLLELWSLPADVIGRRCDHCVYRCMAKQIQGVDIWRQWKSKMRQVRDAVTHDLLPLRDGRVIACHSLPQLVHGNVVGRVFTFSDVTGREGT